MNSLTTAEFVMNLADERDSEGLWYDLCYKFYAYNDSIGKEAIQWFQNHSPNQMNSLHSSNSPLTHKIDEEALTKEKEALYRSCGIFECTEDQWYSYEKIKNSARSRAHSDGTKKRLLEAVHDAQILQINQQHTSLATTKQILIKFLDFLPTNYSLAYLREIFIEWIRQQLQYQTCTILYLEVSEFTERTPEITHQILSFLCSISRYHLPEEYFIPLSNPGKSITIQYQLSDNITPSDIKFQWTMKENLSNSFLRSLLDLLTAKQYQKYGAQFNLRSNKLSQTIQSDITRERIDEIDDIEEGIWGIFLCCFK